MAFLWKIKKLNKFDLENEIEKLFWETTFYEQRLETATTNNNVAFVFS